MTRAWLPTQAYHPIPAYRAACAVLSVCLLSIVGGYLYGRHTAPARIEVRTVTKTETVEVVKWKEVVRTVTGPVRTVERIVERTGPAGPERTIERTIEASPVVSDVGRSGESSSESSSFTETKRVETRQPDWRVAVGVVASDPLGLLRGGQGGAPGAPLAYGAEVSRRILGPFWLGVGATTKGTLQVNAAFTF